MRLIILLLFMVILFFIIVMIVDVNRFVVKEYTLKNEKLKKDYTFVLLADLHNKAFGRENSKLVKKIKEINPDSIVVAGDMLTATYGHDYQNALHLMEQLSETYPIYYGNGNHEYRLRIYPDTYGSMYENYENAINSMGIKPLCNESVFLKEVNLNITGVEIDRYYFKKFHRKPMEDGYLEALVGKRRNDCMQLLIAHNPEYFEKYAKWGADITVSGHIHGGAMVLPFLGGVISPSFRLFPKYDGGKFELGKAIMILSRGLGTHTIPVRIFNPGELVVVHLLAQK